MTEVESAVVAEAEKAASAVEVADVEDEEEAVAGTLVEFWGMG